jgi:glyoxylate reductase
VTRPLPAGTLGPLADHDIVVPTSPPSPAELAGLAPDALVVQLVDRVDGALLDAAPSLRVVATVSVGYDNVDVAAATERGVVVCNTPGVLDETTADLAFALILAAARRTSDAEADLRAGRWDGFEFERFLGTDVHGATLGIVGYGRIGRAVAQRAAGFAMVVLHWSRTPTGEPGWIDSLDHLLERSDILSLHVPLTPETHHLIGARELARMRPHAVLVNTARGPVVDEVALADALGRGTIFGAGLDVYEDEPRVHPRLLAAPHAVLVPHVGSATIETRRAMARLAVTGVRDALAGVLPANAVNADAWPRGL